MVAIAVVGKAVGEVVEEKFEKYFGYLHEPLERMRWQKPFCRVTLSRFWMSELIFCRALPDLGIF